jgi:glycosyltransferase involved in cell wall biosynthesis
MKVLLGHCFYRSSAPSGEDAVYRNERAMLEKHCQVIPYEKYNDDIDESGLGKKVRLALDGAWSRRTYDEISNLIRTARPDVAHFHNTFPQISASAYAACRDHGVPVVQTLHNFRFVCPGAMLIRDGKPCEDCLGTSLLPALRHRCYRNSLLATGAQVWTIASNRWRGSYRNLVDRYIALSRLAAEKLIAGGLPAERMEVKPNFLPDIAKPGSGNGGYAVYVGRLSEEKGVRTLLKAWEKLRLPLRILGDGPLRSELEQHAKRQGLAVEFYGYCSKQDVLTSVGEATLMVVPSEWYEGFPMAVLEAYASGTPVVASAIGSLDEIVEEGVTGAKFEPGNADSLVDCMTRLLARPEKLRAIRKNVRRHFLNHYSEQRNMELLTTVYQAAISDFQVKLTIKSLTR